jgi:hypothetical protein
VGSSKLKTSQKDRSQPRAENDRDAVYKRVKILNKYFSSGSSYLTRCTGQHVGLATGRVGLKRPRPRSPTSPPDPDPAEVVGWNTSPAPVPAGDPAGERGPAQPGWKTTRRAAVDETRRGPHYLAVDGQRRRGEPPPPALGLAFAARAWPSQPPPVPWPTPPPAQVAPGRRCRRPRLADAAAAACAWPSMPPPAPGRRRRRRPRLAVAGRRCRPRLAVDAAARAWPSTPPSAPWPRHRPCLAVNAAAACGVRVTGRGDWGEGRG